MEKIEPIDFLIKKANIISNGAFRSFCDKNKDYKIADAGDKFIAILPTQEYDEKTCEIIDITDKLFENQKQEQIKINSAKCRLAIYKFLGVDNDKDAEIKQLNMLLEVANNDKNAPKALKKYQETKEKYRKINKELKEKINNSKTIDEIKSYDFDDKIKEIGEIDDL
jgi:hypothetical protein